MNEHKEEILRTRKGCLGGSDAKMLMTIAQQGVVPKSAMKRLAVCKGLIEQESFTSKAMEFGNYIEDCVFQNLHANDERWQSNPCLTSKRYSRENCKVIDHVDFFLQDDENKILNIGECKATKFTYSQTRDAYMAQLKHHYLLGIEYAQKLGKGWKVRVMLCHYLTDGLDLNKQWEFDPTRLTVKNLRFTTRMDYNLDKAMDIVNDFLQDFNEYYDGDEIDAMYLPEPVKKEFDVVTTIMNEIKEREKQVDEFKQRLYDFMCKRNIKNIKSDYFTISCVGETESKTFDYKKFLADFRVKHPRKADKLVDEYTKTTKRKGYASIKLKEQKEQ